MSTRCKEEFIKVVEYGPSEAARQSWVRLVEQQGFSPAAVPEDGVMYKIPNMHSNDSFCAVFVRRDVLTKLGVDEDSLPIDSAS